MQLNLDPAEDYYYAIALAVLALFTAPVVIYANNFIDLHHVDPLPALAILGISAIAMAAILCAGLYLLSRLRLQMAGVILRPLFFFLLFMMLIQPLIGGTAELKIASLRIPVWWLTLILFILAMMFWTFSRASGTLLFVSLVFVALNAAVHVYQVFASSGTKNKAAIETLSSGKNLIVVSLDGVTRDIAREVLDKHPELKARLKDFVFFTNAVSSAPNTRASIIAEIGGTQNLKQRFDNERTMVRTIPRNSLLPNILAANGYGVATYGEYSSTLTDQKNGFPVGKLLQTKSAAYHVVNAVDLFHFAMPVAFAPDRLAQILQNIWLTITGRGDPANSTLDRLNAHKGERWERALLLSGVEFDTYLNRLRTGGDASRAHFLHFVHTHWPISIDSKCAYKADDLKWYLGHQNGKAHRAVILCSLSQFATVLQKLKDLKIYDDTTIVLKGDHGEIAHYMDRTKLESFTFHGHQQLGYARYTPMLAIKRRQQASAHMSFDARPVSLSDLAQTLCKSELGANAACKSLKGFDILDQKLVIPAQASYDLYIPTNATSDWKMDDHTAVKIPRRPGFFAVLNDKMSNGLLRAALPCATPADLTRGQSYNNGKSDGKSWVTWRHEQAWHVKTRMPSCAASQIIIRFAAKTLDPAATGAAVVRINGQIIAPSQGKSAGGTDSWTLPVPAGIKPGEPMDISITQPPGNTPLKPAVLEFAAGQPTQ